MAAVEREGVYLRYDIGYDNTSCLEVDLEPGASCSLAINIHPSEEPGASLAITLSALTNASAETSYVQFVTVTEVDTPAAPPPPVPGTTVTLALGPSVCDANYICELVPTTQDVISGGQFSWVDASFRLNNADGTTDVAQIVSINSAIQLDETTYSYTGTNAVYDANGVIIKTVDWELVFTVLPDGLSAAILSGTLSITAWGPGPSVPSGDD